MSYVTDLREPNSISPKADRNSSIETDQFLLLREMHHRLANTLQMLSAILRRDLSSAIPPEFRRSLDQYESRIVAYGNLHRWLVVGSKRGFIPVQGYIQQLCRAISIAILEPIDVRCEVYVDDGELSGERCELIGLVIAEIVTNAAKHAFYGRNNGLVRVEILRQTEAWVCVVSDNGDGFAHVHRD